MTPLEIAAKAAFERQPGSWCKDWEGFKRVAPELASALIEDVRAAFLAFADAEPTEGMGKVLAQQPVHCELGDHLDTARAYIRAGANEKPTEGME